MPPAHPTTTRRSLASLERDLRTCRLCLDAGYPITPPPVAAPSAEATASPVAYLFGQSPGRVEADEGRPWRGRAGHTLRRWLELEEQEFYATFHCASVTRCFPGPAPSGRGDRTPTVREQQLCSTWWVREIALLGPHLVVTVGAIALRQFLGTSLALADAVGKSLVARGAILVPLPHPSGASGWLNEATNRARLGKACTHIRREVARLQEEQPGAEPR